jgi:preprotein translocase subunit SecF
MNIIKHRKIYFVISGLLVSASIASIFIFGLKLGIDFTGGSLMEISVLEDEKITSSQIQSILTFGENPLLESVQVQPTAERGFILRFKDVSEDEHQEILKALEKGLAEVFSVEPTEDELILESESLDNQEEDFAQNQELRLIREERFESIGPVIGKELREKSISAIIAVLVGIILYIAWAFRKVSDPVSSWKYGITAIIALIHDVLVPVGVFCVLGAYWGVEIDILFVTALLTILGYSVNDTIVVFDRTRENLAKSHYHGDFEEIVNESVNQTIPRSINTSVTTLLVLVSVFFFGGESIKYFVLALIIGASVGTYSSIFLASPILVESEKLSRRISR